MTNDSAREKEIMSATLRLLKKELSPRRIILFGSRAEGRAHQGSDFDIAVDARTPRFSKRRMIQDQIEGFSGLYHVDLVFMSKVSKGFRQIIEQTGKIVYER